MESKLQSLIIKFLKSNGAYVVKTKPQPGTPVGCPDILAFYKNRWLAIEVKAGRDAPFRAGQKITLEKLRSGNRYVYVAYPENWSEIQSDILFFFF